MTQPTPMRFREAREAFVELLDLDAQERQARLAELSAADPELGRRVAGLIAADDRAQGFLEGSAGELAPEVVRDWLETGPREASAGTVGPYRLLEVLGRGGMGEVYLAERVDGQFEQRVAVKLLKRGMDSEEILRRFLRERQILARLEHPGIARLLDGGLAADGRPYFVLERVEGEPITDWCRERRAPLARRLSLIVACCDAADAAHRQLVVHRDLKPSNVLVTTGGEVKLLDFGIAKLLGGDGEGGETALTRLDDRVLTPAYAAPEQILGGPVTTATDVYALGVMLYELLTGRLPHERESLGAAALPGAVERETVERPSTAVRRFSAEEAGDSLRLPDRERRRLPQRLSGDLDTIVLKALHREPARRYPSAAALAEDLRDHLEGRPVRARPDTLRYRARKFVARHKAAVASAALVFLSLVGGLAATAWQARRAAVAAGEARANALRAERVKEFLIGLFETADPEQGAGAEVTAKELLEQAVDRLETELSADPVIRADLLEAVARIDANLGLLEPAEALARRAVSLHAGATPPNGAALASAEGTLGAVRASQGRLEEAAELLAKAHERLAASEPENSLTLARVRNDYAQVLFWQSRLVESEALVRKVFEAYRAVLGADHLKTAHHQRNLGVLLEELDRLDEAEEAYRQSQAVIEHTLGPDHLSAAQSYINLAVLLDRRQRFDEAEALYLRAVAVCEKRLGPDHPTTARFYQLHGHSLLERGRLDEAEVAYAQALEVFRRVNPEHFEVGKCLNGLALIASRRGDHAAAEQTLREVVRIFQAVLGPEHPFTWQATGNLARAIAEQGRLAEAETLQREVLARLEKLTGPETEEVAEAASRLADTLRRAGREEEAETLAARAKEIRAKLGDTK